MSIKTYILALDCFSFCFWPEMALVSQLDVFEMQVSLPIMNETMFSSSKKCQFARFV